MKLPNPKLASLVFLCVFALYPLSSMSKKAPKTPISFSANMVEENKETEVVTATGNVEITREGTTLFADKIIYDRKNDTINAYGNVQISHADGTKAYATSAELSDKMSKANINDVKFILADESRLSSQRIKQSANQNKYFFYSVYTPCDTCEQNPKPFWQIKAKKITHDTKNKNVYYQHALLEIKDIPVFYAPFLSHPDPSVKRRSGFLTPSMRSNNYLGTSVELRYFWNISDQEDFLFTPIISSDKGIVWAGEYNKVFYKGDTSISATFLNDEDSKENRYSIFGKMRYEINDKWVAKVDINYASDGAYLKDLGLPLRNDTWLTSQIAVEMFDIRDYASIEAYSYKLISYDLRTQNYSLYEKSDYGKPYVLPIIDYETYSNTNAIGAYFKNNFNMASIYREHDQTQTQRLSMINSWNLPYTDDWGSKYKITASLKSDLYYIDNYINSDNEEYSGATGRIFPQIGAEWRLPLIKASGSSRQIVEPVVVATFAPNGNNKTDKIPNEDSLNAQLNDTNILNLDRYNGYDRNDTGSRISYGLNWSAYGNIMGRTSAFIAQSFYIQQDESYAEAVGDEEQFSDYVGRVYASPNKYLDLNYRFRLDKKTFDIEYNEIDLRLGTDILSTSLAYIYMKEQDYSNTSGLYFFDDYDTKKELYVSIQAKLSQNWRISAYNRFDLTEGSDSLEHGGKLIYDDECFNIVFNAQKYNSTDPDYDDGYEFSATFLLKTLGGVGSN